MKRGVDGEEDRKEDKDKKRGRTRRGKKEQEEVRGKRGW